MDITSKAEVYQAAVELMDESGYPADYRADYSGRGMYGDTTPAIVTEHETMIGWAIAGVVAGEVPVHDDMEYFLEASRDLIPRRTDQMGRSSTIFY